MKKAFLEDVEKLVVKDVPLPKSKAGEVLVKVRYCKICGSDLHIYKIGPHLRLPGMEAVEKMMGVPLPQIIGHEFCGEITEVGPDVKKWKVGDRVVGQGNGAYAEYVLLPAENLLRMPDEMSYEQGAFVEPLNVAVAAVERSEFRLGDVAVVLGLGPIGLLVLQCAKAAGAREVYATEIIEERLRLAKQLGANEVINAKVVDPVKRVSELTEGMGPDVVFECAGASVTFNQMLEMSRMGPNFPDSERGRAVIVAVYERPIELGIDTSNYIMFKNLKVIGSYGSRDSGALWHPWKTAITLIADGRVKVKPLITATLPLEKINEGFQGIMKGEQLGVLIKP